MSEESTKKSQNLAGRTAQGSTWIFAGTFFARLSDMILLVLLARLLAPQDFGLVAVALSFIAILDVVTEVPLIAALVRLDRIDKRYLDTAFTIGLIRFVLIFLLVFAIASPFADFYGDPRLAEILIVLGLSPSMRVMQSPALAELFKELRFRQSFMIEVGGKLAGFATAILIGVITNSYWALVASPVAANVFNCGLSYYFAPYRPRLSLAEGRYFWGFLGWMLPAQLSIAMMWQFDRLFLGSVIPKATLGFYSIAYNLTAYVQISIRRAVSQPLISSFSLVAKEPERMRRGYLMIDSGIIMVGVPCHLLIFFLADPIVAIALGAKWAPAAPYLQWLALALLPAMARLPFRALAMAVGRTDYFFYTAAISTCIRIPSVIIGYNYAEIWGVIIAIGLTGIANAIIAMHFTRRIAGIRFVDQLRASWRTLVGCGLPSILAWYANTYLEGLDGFALVLGLATTCLLFFIVYILAIFLLWLASGSPDGIENRVASKIRSRLSRGSAHQ